MKEALVFTRASFNLVSFCNSLPPGKQTESPF
jgi:hypothetical protein